MPGVTSHNAVPLHALSGMRARVCEVLCIFGVREYVYRNRKTQTGDANGRQ
jgi:hypothetical protein